MQWNENLIGEVLVRKGYVDERQVEEALDLQKVKTNKRLGELLVELAYIDEEKLLEALSELHNVPFQKELETHMDTAVITRVPLHFIKQYKMVPYREEPDFYLVAIHDPLNLLPLDDLRLLLDKPVKPVLSTTAEIEKVVNHYFDQHTDSAAQVIEDLDEEEIGILSPMAVPEEERDLLDIAHEAPIIKLINLIVSGAVKDRASDIHIEPFERDLRVRYRIDGVLYDVLKPPKAYQAAITSRIKIMANMNIAERRLPQDGRIRIRLAGRDIDIRASAVPIAHGERLVLRILDRTSFLFDLTELGLHQKDYDTFRSLLNSSHGIILLTGPTGSGKTTTLYAALSRLNAAEKNILTIEDPIEYQMQGIGQIQVMPKIGLTFANALRSILRQDPDVILVGEVRDLETAEMAIHASLTGHLVFSTLHTNDSAGATTRLVDMGIEPYLVSSSVIAVMAQRLVRLICPDCREEYKPDDATLADIGLSEDDLRGRTIYRGKGCDTCSGRGYLGRTGIYELLVVDSNIQNLIVSRADSNVIKREARKNGMVTLREDGLRKMLAGLTTLEEVLRMSREETTVDVTL
jgi:general secretion pathway protein E